MDPPKKCASGPMKDIADYVPKIVASVDWTNRSQNILDYGCGNGKHGFTYILPKVVESSSKLYAVDISETLVEKAKEGFPHPAITYQVGNIMDSLDKFPFQDVQFDKIFSLFVFHFLAEPKEAFKRLNGLLKPGGQMAFVTYKTCFFNAVSQIAEMDKWNPFLKDFKTMASPFAFAGVDKDYSEMRSVLAEAGFRIDTLDYEDREHTFDDIEPYLRSTVANIPFVSNVPKDMLPELTEEYRTVITKIAGVPRDSISFTYKYQCVYGVVTKV